MIALIFYSFAAFGLAYVAGHAVITRWIREWMFNHGVIPKTIVMLVECAACFGFWTGFIFGLVMNFSLIFSIVIGLYTTGSNTLLGKIAGIME
jgi:hypothetical protein